MSAPPSKLVRGTVDLLVLRAVSTGRKHGYQVWSWIEENSDDVVRLEDAALYQSLHRLQKKGLLTSEWGQSENNRRARFYTLTAKGRKRLEAETSEWRSYARAVERLLGAG